MINTFDFDNLIGGGGFGNIYSSSKHPNLVLKNIIDVSTCPCAQYEFMIHKSIYDSFTTINECHPLQYIYIPKPITFDNHKNGCSYIMEKLNFINNNFIHLTINDIFPSSGKDKEIGRIYTEPVSDTNPTRGYFPSINTINNILLKYNNMQSISDIVLRMGYLFGTMVFGARVYPIDVEYGLVLYNNNLCVSVIDFGLCLPHSFELNEVPLPEEYKKCAKPITNTVNFILDTIFFDIYYSPEETYINDYISGMTIAYECFKPLLNKNAELLYKKIINYLNTF